MSQDLKIPHEFADPENAKMSVVIGQVRCEVIRRPWPVTSNVLGLFSFDEVLDF